MHTIPIKLADDFVLDLISNDGDGCQHLTLGVTFSLACHRLVNVA